MRDSAGEAAPARSPIRELTLRVVAMLGARIPGRVLVRRVIANRVAVVDVTLLTGSRSEREPAVWLAIAVVFLDCAARMKYSTSRRDKRPIRVRVPRVD